MNITFFKEQSGDNNIFVLKGKLEDWIVSICKKYKIDITSFNLPKEPNKLHDVINQRLTHFGKLLDALLKQGNPALLKLKSWLEE